jgi:hypothetical protein
LDEGFELLRQLGVFSAIAKRLADKYDAERIKAGIAYAQEAAERHFLSSMASCAVTAIERGWASLRSVRVERLSDGPAIGQT